MKDGVVCINNASKRTNEVVVATSQTMNKNDGGNSIIIIFCITKIGVMLHMEASTRKKKI